MNPFEKHSIAHLSPSNLNLYVANPSLWVGRYLFKWKDEFGPSAARGSAIEDGVSAWLFQRDFALALSTAYATFRDDTQGVTDDEHEAEFANIEPMLKQATDALKEFPIPLARQVRCEYYANGVEVPIIGYIDYSFEGFDLDLKTTKALPSSIKADHARQFATYGAARSKPQKALYVTAKKSAVYELTEEHAAQSIKDVDRIARAVRHLLARADDAEDARKFFAPDFSDFRWSEKTQEAANTLYQAA